MWVGRNIPTTFKQNKIMSQGINYLHSHSGLERTLRDDDIVNKSHVLIDEQYKMMFADGAIRLTPLKINGVRYYKVPILSFVRKNGVFKNLNS